MFACKTYMLRTIAFALKNFAISNGRGYDVDLKFDINIRVCKQMVADGIFTTLTACSL